MQTKNLFLTALAAANGMAALAANTSKPNVVIIYMDDLGYGDIEANGMTGIPMPHLNLLASQGIRFTNFEVSQPISTASRCSLLTGCYANRLGMGGVLLIGDRYALNPQEETIAKLLKDNGYYTGMFGKWHLGNQPPYFPTSYGFDEFVGLPYSHDMWNVDYHGNTKPADTKPGASQVPTLRIYNGNAPVDSIMNL